MEFCSYHVQQLHLMFTCGTRETNTNELKNAQKLNDNIYVGWGEKKSMFGLV